MEDRCIKAENLTIGFPDISLIEGASFEVRQGDWLGIQGGPETGKTSLLLALCGVKAFYDGTIEIFGYPVEDPRERYKKYLGLVSQESGLFENLTTGENIDFVATIHGCKTGSKEYKALREELISQLELADLMPKRVKALTRGPKKRVALACALIHRPRLLLLDELTKDVDDQSVRLLQEAVARYHKAGGTCVSVLSDLEDVSPFSHVGMIYEKTLSVYSQEQYLKHYHKNQAAGVGR